MSTSTEQRVQSPLNMILPIKSWLELGELSAVMQFKEGQMTGSREAVGSAHFVRFVEMHDHNCLGYFGVFDGEYRTYFSEFINYAGRVLDVLFKHVVDGPPLPCERNREAFIEWIIAHNLEGIGFYSAYPTLPVKEIRTRTGTELGGVDLWSGQSPLTVVLQVESPTHFVALSQYLTQFLPQLYAALDRIGTVHFFRFVPVGTRAMVLVAEHDLPPENLVQGFSTHLGAMFDEIFGNVIDGPPTPVQKNTRAFTDWIVAHNLKTWGLYSAYPALSVQEIRALATNRAA